MSRITKLLVMFTLLTTVVPAHAHIASHSAMGVVEGLRHMFTETSHLLLLVPALLLVGVFFVRKYRVNNDSIKK